ncbi:MAG: tryptophan synthase subunit alpha [Thermoplasmata archaeon]|nr:tryptophan synthase subunit alpha [Thermoplasmata archaeon]
MRLGNALQTARRAGPLLIPYLLVDRRRTSRLPAVARALRAAGAAALELGFPFSDPIADGPVLEAAGGRSLAAGTGWADLIASARATAQILPTAVMTYANPVWRHGLSHALQDLHRAGVSGLIVPDLSLEESAPWRAAGRAAEIEVVLLAAPGIEPARLRRISRASRGFLYLVSRYGTTGAGRAQGREELAALVRASHEVHPSLPVLVGFGVRDRATARAALSTGADGVVVGTALEEKLESGAREGEITRWARSLLGPGSPHVPRT